MPASASAAFDITNFQLNPSTKAASAHPNLFVSFERKGTETEDLRDFGLHLAPGLTLSPNAVPSSQRCSDSKFFADQCPGTSWVGTASVNMRATMYGASFFSGNVPGTVVALSSATPTLGVILRPHLFGRIVIKLPSSASSLSGGQLWQASNLPRSAKLFGFFNADLTINRVQLSLNARSGYGATGPYLVTNPSTCTVATSKLNGISYQGASVTRSSSFTPTGCSGPTAPTVSIVSPANGSTTGDSTPTLDYTVSDAAATCNLVDGSDLGPYTDGPQSVNVTCTNAGGNGSATSNFNVDTTPPAAPVITSVGGLTNDNTPTIVGTAEPGSTVVIYDGVAAIGSITASASGSWSFTPAASIGEGSHSITATAADAVGNIGPPSAPVAIDIDSIAPAAPVITSPTDGSTSSDDTPTVSGTAEPGSNVRVDRDGSTLVCQDVADAAGDFTCDASTSLAPGTYSLTAVAADDAGNSGSASAAVSITISAAPTVPPAPVISSPTAGQILIDDTPAFSGTAEGGSTVDVTEGAATVCSTTASAAGAWSCDALVALSDGNHTVEATATNVVGTGPASAPRSFTVDTIVPATPVITSTGGVTTDNTPTITGTAEADSTVVVYDGVTAIGSTTATAGGSWSFTPVSSIGEGASSITATASDAAGNTSSPSAPVVFDVDSIAPAAPVITVPVEGAPSVGASAAISGTSEASSSVTVGESSTTICTATANATGDWSCTPSTALSNGAHSITASASDSAGNVSPNSLVRSFTVAPVVSAPTVQITTGPEGGLPIDDTTPSWEFVVTGTATSVECRIDSGSFAPCSSPYTAASQLNGSHSFDVRVTNSGGSNTDTATFEVGAFAPTWNINLSTTQAMGHPDVTATATNPYGDAEDLVIHAPRFFLGSLNAVPRCPLADAQAGTCGTTTPGSKIGEITFTADVDPNPHNNTVPPHSVTRTYDGYLTHPAQPGDAAGVALHVRAIDDAAYGSLDYGTIDYVGRLKLRYSGPGGVPDYTSTYDPQGMDIILDDIPNSTLPGPGVTPGPAGAADLHIRSLSAVLYGDDPSYNAPLTYNSSDCDNASSFDATVVSSAGNNAALTQNYQATGCDTLPFAPVVGTFALSNTGANQLINSMTVGVTFPSGSIPVRNAVVDMPRSMVAVTSALTSCGNAPSGSDTGASVMVDDPQAACSDLSNLGTATATSPLLIAPLTGDIIAEDSGGTLPNLYMVFKDPSIGLDARIRANALVTTIPAGTGGPGGAVSGDFIRTSLNVDNTGSQIDVPPLPLSGLTLTLQTAAAGDPLPDGEISLGPVMRVGNAQGCMNEDAAKFSFNSWSNPADSNYHFEAVSPQLLFTGCPRQSVQITAGPSSGSTVGTSSVTFTVKNNTATATTIRCSIDDLSLDVGCPTFGSVAAGTSVSRTVSGLTEGAHKFLIQGGATVDQDERVFKVDLP